jgi:hypothetical protein
VFWGSAALREEKFAIVDFELEGHARLVDGRMVAGCKASSSDGRGRFGARRRLSFNIRGVCVCGDGQAAKDEAFQVVTEVKRR